MTWIKIAELSATSGPAPVPTSGAPVTSEGMPDNDLCVTRVPIFQGLSRDDQLQVAGFVSPLHVHKGDVIYSPGQLVSRLLVMHSGSLKVSRIGTNGQERVLRTVSDGEVVGERAMLTGERSDDLVTALEDSRMCTLGRDDLAGLLGRYPDVGMRMLRTVSDRLASTERLLAAVTFSDVSARVAAYLLDRPGQVRDGKVTVHLPMSKHDVAAYLGTTPETLSRRLAALTSAGIIELQGRRNVVVHDPDALERVAAGDTD